MNKLFGLLTKLKKKNKEIKKEIYANKNIILKLANKIKEVYKDCIYIISSEELPLEYFNILDLKLMMKILVIVEH